jgi:(S)-2-hydroxy-acid oxidase
MSTSLLGYDMSSPIILAPTGAQKLANPEGTKTRSLTSFSFNRDHESYEV